MICYFYHRKLIGEGFCPCLFEHNFLVYSEPLLKDTLNKGHNTFNLSIKDKSLGPHRTMANTIKRATSV